MLYIGAFGYPAKEGSRLTNGSDARRGLRRSTRWYLRAALLGLAAFFAGSAGVVLFAALRVPSATPPELEERVASLSQEQAVSREAMSALQRDIARLEEELAKRPGPAAEVTADGASHLERVFVLGGGLFDSGSVQPNARLRDAVVLILPELMRRAEDRIVVEGHTDNVPVTHEDPLGIAGNDQLSRLRAETVRLLLIDMGIAQARVEVRGFGDSRPVASNASEEGRARNRRVEIRVLPPS